MANYVIPDNPIYSSEIRKFEPTDPAHADLFNAVFQAIINNLEYLRQSEKVKIGPPNTELQCGETLFLVEDELTFSEAAYTNFVLSEEVPQSVKNWGMLEGKLTVAEEPESDTVFFVPINDKE